MSIQNPQFVQLVQLNLNSSNLGIKLKSGLAHLVQPLHPIAGPHGNVTLVTLLLVLLGGCASCMLPCTRRTVRRRRQLAIPGSSQPVLLNVEDHVEVPAVQTALQQDP